MPRKDQSRYDSVPDNVLQFDHRSRSSTIEVVIGVDFGTSSTKAVIHVFGIPGDPAFVVPFGEFAHESSEYLLPTRLSVARKGKCSLTYIPRASLFTDMKVRLIQNRDEPLDPVSGPPCKVSAPVAATAYLALVLRHIRRWFIGTKDEAFGDYRLNWSYNLGLPAETDDSSIRHTFESLSKAAWFASIRPGAVTISNVRKALEDILLPSSKLENVSCEFDLVPEVVAAVVGYARSPLRNEGLHLLIDVGASTLDVCSFILSNSNGEDRFEILTADVRLLDAKQLHVRRIESMKKSMKSNVEAHAQNLLSTDDPLSIIPDDLQCYKPSDRILFDHIRDVEENFLRQCMELLGGIFKNLRSHKDPDSPRWSERFPLFVCGGASRMGVYRDVATRIDQSLKDWLSQHPGTRPIPLRKPDSLEANISNEFYHRLAVAWGLSHQSFNIPGYRLPSQIPNFEPQPVRRADIEGRYISKDVV